MIISVTTFSIIDFLWLSYLIYDTLSLNGCLLINAPCMIIKKLNL